MKKKALSLFISAVMLSSVFVVSAAAAPMMKAAIQMLLK